MKKVIAMIVVIMVIVVTYSVVELSVPKEIVNEYYLFTKGDTTGSGVWLYGDTYMSSCKSDKIIELMQNTSNLLAMQYSINGDYDDMKKLMRTNNVAVVDSETVGDTYIIYGLSDRATGRNVSILGKQVNIQLAIRNNTITVGTPLIMGSY